MIVSQLQGVGGRVFPTSYQEPPGVEMKMEEDRMYDIARATNGRLKQIQEQEFEKARRMDNEMKLKAAEEEKQKKHEEQKAAEDLKRQEEAKQKKKAQIPPEPEAGDPEACEIAFRLPSGKRVTRRFHKSTTIEVITSLLNLH